MERPSSSRSKRASLRNSVPLDDAYLLYEQERAGNHAMYNHQQRPHSQHSSHFFPVETDLDDGNPGDLHMVDAGTLLSPHHRMSNNENDIFVRGPSHVQGHSPPMSTEEEALYDTHFADDEKYGLAQSEDEYMHMIANEELHHRQVGIYGWRKKIIYLILAFIVLLVAINAALTFWIISFLGFSSVRLLFFSHCILLFLIHTLCRMEFPA